VQGSIRECVAEKTDEVEGLLMGPHGLDEITAKMPVKLPDNNGPGLGALPYRYPAPRTRTYSCRMQRFCRNVDQ
jgi:hypothetical protein